MGGMEWIDLAQDGNWWWSLVQAVINIRASQNACNFFTSG